MLFLDKSMEEVSIKFLGTGNAVPTKLRNHTAILVTIGNENILVDCGEGTQRQFMYANLSPTKITKLLVTHWHGDHILGIPGLLQTLAMSEYSKTLHIYGPKGTNYFMNLMSELFKDFKLNLKVEEITSTAKSFGQLQIESEEMLHDAATNAYAIILKDRVHLDKKKLKKYKLPNSPILKELQNGRNIVFNGKTIKASSITYREKGKKIAIILDTGMTPNAIQIANNADVLICEATFSKEEEAQAKEYRHLTAEQAATIAKKAKVKKLILTHISQRYEHNTKIIEKEAKKIFKNTSVVKDLDEIKV